MVIYRFFCNVKRFQRALLAGKGCCHDRPAFSSGSRLPGISFFLSWFMCTRNIFSSSHILQFEVTLKPESSDSQGHLGHITLYSGQSPWASFHPNLSWVVLYRCCALRLWSTWHRQHANFISQAGECRAGRINNFTISCQWPGRQEINISSGLWVGVGRKHINYITGL